MNSSGPLGRACSVDDDCLSCSLACVNATCECAWEWSMAGEWCDEPTLYASTWIIGRSCVLLVFSFLLIYSMRVICGDANGMRWRSGSFAAVLPFLSLLGSSLIIMDNVFMFVVGFGLVRLNHTERNLEYMFCSSAGIGLISVSFFVISLRWLEHARILEQYLGSLSNAKYLIIAWIAFFAFMSIILFALAPMYPDPANLGLAGLLLVNGSLVMVFFSLGSQKLAKVLADATAQQLRGVDRTTSKEDHISKELRRVAKMRKKGGVSPGNPKGDKGNLLDELELGSSSDYPSCSSGPSAGTGAGSAACSEPSSKIWKKPSRVMHVRDAAASVEGRGMSPQHKRIQLLRRVARTGLLISQWMGGLVVCTILWQVVYLMSAFYVSPPAYWILAFGLHYCGARASITLLYYLDVSVTASERRKVNEASSLQNDRINERDSGSNNSDRIESPSCCEKPTSKRGSVLAPAGAKQATDGSPVLREGVSNQAFSSKV